MQTVLADLHVHTLLSPCAEVEMTPHHIVMRAAEYGIGAVAITDHNASANVPAALEAARSAVRMHWHCMRDDMALTRPIAQGHARSRAANWRRSWP